MSTDLPGPAEERAQLVRALTALKDLRLQLDALRAERCEPIAIIGIGCRFPGGVEDPEGFWRLLHAGVDAIGEIPRERWDPDAYYSADPDAPGKMCTRHGGFLAGLDRFDPAFFGMAPREAGTLDPQQRLLLETAWEALEYAGLAPDRLRGSRTGVYVGISSNDFVQLLLSADPARLDAYAGSGTAHSVAAGRLSYVFGFEGPAVAVDTACSSSLVAVHLACQSLRLGESELALAGGVNVLLTPSIHINHTRARMLAPDGRCKAFDARADGFVRSEGCGLVLLKRLAAARADGDPILAVIRGSASNQDGHTSGLTVPNGPSQQAVIRAALDMAGLTPAQVTYVEAHGTGTALGDPIELNALGAVFGAGRPPGRPLAVGSVKTNIGHAEAAAGIAGLIKTVLALQHEIIPPQLHFQRPNPRIDWAALPVTVPTVPQPWPRGAALRVAGVSAFGFGGTNVHVVLAEAPPPAAAAAPPRPRHLFTLSAPDAAGLKALAARYAAHLAAHPGLSLADLCHTANTGRARFVQRLAISADSVPELGARLAECAAPTPAPGLILGTANPAQPPRLVFLFTGQGAQYAGMGRQLYETQAGLRADLDHCDLLLRPYLERPLLEVLYPARPDAAIDQTAYTQPALFALEYALARLWMSWGVRPDLVMGHSLGEYVAACLAGVFGLEDGLRLVAARARLMQERAAPGAMAAVFAAAADVRATLAALAPEVAVAAVNGPRQVVVSGPAAALAPVLEHWAGLGIETRTLKVNRAFHSALVEPMLAEFERVASTVVLSPPSLDLVSNLTGALAGAEVAEPGYWCRHARAPVQFLDAMRTLQAQGADLFLEVGPQPVLLGLGRSCLDRPESVTWLPSLVRGRTDWQSLQDSLAELYVRGVPVDWQGWDAGQGCRRLRLPSYPFQRQRYWAAPAVGDQARVPPARHPGVAADHPLLGTRFSHARQPEEILFEGVLSAARPDFLGGHRVLGTALMPAAGYVEMALAAGAAAGLAADRRCIADVSFHRPLTFPDGEERCVQTSLLKVAGGGYEFRVHARAGAAADWTLHATATLTADAPRPPPPMDLEALRRRMTEPVPAAALYAAYARHGVEFGPVLGAVRELWRGPGEALARVVPPADLGRAPGYRLHPVWLDACAQVLGAVTPESAGTWVQARIGRVNLYATPGASAWAYARLRAPAGAASRRADLCLFDEEGRILAELEDLAARPLDPGLLHQCAAAPAGLRLYGPCWLDRPRAAVSAALLPAPGVLAAALAPALHACLADPRLLDYGQALSGLDAQAPGYVAAAFRQLGWPYRPGQRFTAAQVRASLGVVGHPVRLLERLLEILAESGSLCRAGTAWELTADLPPAPPGHPGAGPGAHTGPAWAETELLARCGGRLGEVLQGRCEPLSLLFPDDGRTSAASIYGDSPGAVAMHGLLRRAVADICAALPPGRALRVLEVGAGTGGATAQVLPELPPDTDYVYTDISPGFLAPARVRFAAYPFVRYQALDIERPPADQGFAGGEYDLVIAFNVLHATRSLAETLNHVQGLLAPGGLLLLLENTEPAPWVDLIWGLTPGWWRFDDDDTRPAYPLLSAARWTGLLAGHGFAAPAVVAADPRCHGALARQALVIARKADPPPGRRPWVILSDGAGVGQALSARLRARGARVVAVARGAAFARTGEDTYVLDPLAPGDFGLLLAGLGEVPATIVHLWGLDAANAADWTADTLSADALALTGGALRLVQALAASPGAAPVLWLVTRGAQVTGGEARPPALTQAALWGLGMTVAREYPPLWGGLIDLDPAAPPGEAAALLDALQAPDGEDLLALRGQARRVLRLAPLDPVPVPGRGPRVRDDATYLITGGLGGLGLEIARWLAVHGARRLVLLGRRGAASAAAQAAVAALQERGVAVEVRSADVADAAALAEVLADLCCAALPLRGIVHAAGLPGHATLAELGPEDFGRLFAAKVAGAWNLHRLSLDADLDFFVCCSSMVSLWGTKGQGHYVAANGFLDLFVHYRRALGLPALGVNWGPLEGGGMLSPQDVPELRRIGVFATPMAATVAVLGPLLESDLAQAAPLDIDWPRLRDLYRTRGACRLFDLLADAAPAPRAEPAAPAGILEQLRTVPENERREQLAAHVQAVLGRVLGLDPARQADPQRGFFDMGLDSLMAMELRNRLKESLAADLPATLAFDYGTVDTLTDYLLRVHLGPPAPTAPAPAAVLPPVPPADQGGRQTIDDLSDDEVEAMLRDKLSRL